jgi:hypothetical protein
MPEPEPAVQSRWYQIAASFVWGLKPLKHWRFEPEEEVKMAGLDIKASVTPQWRDRAGRWARADAGGVLAKTVQAWGSNAVRELRDATPVRTGAARAAWRADYLPTERAVKVTNAQPYVPYLIRGTQPHDIYAHAGGYLRFLIGERTVFARVVHHPGTRPSPQLEAAIDRVERSAAVDLHQAGVEIIQQLGAGA